MPRWKSAWPSSASRRPSPSPTRPNCSRRLEAKSSLLAWALVFVLVGAGPFLMGGTLPAIIRSLALGEDRIGSGGGRMYAANTAGAIIGALVSSFVLIPTLGIQGSGAGRRRDRRARGGRCILARPRGLASASARTEDHARALREVRHAGDSPLRRRRRSGARLRSGLVAIDRATHEHPRALPSR